MRTSSKYQLRIPLLDMDDEAFICLSLAILMWSVGWWCLVKHGQVLGRLPVLQAPTPLLRRCYYAPLSIICPVIGSISAFELPVLAGSRTALPGS